MSQIDRLGRDLTVWFAETAAPGTPPYLDDILQQTAHVRQRPRWTSLERLLPMTLTTNVSAVRGSVPWRTVGALVLLILALVVGAVLVGSSQQRLPAPFGPAEAGLVAYSIDGDIVVVDPASNQRRTIVAGDTDDRDPQWSRDGTRIVFERHSDGLSQLFTVRPDGAGLTAITPSPTSIVGDGDGPTYSFSPNGRAVLYMSGFAIRIAQSDGTGVRTIETPDIGLVEVAWRPPDGSQIGAVGARGGIYLVDVADGTLRTLVPPANGVEAGGVSWSPDGSQVAYYPWSTVVTEFTVRARILDIETGHDRLADTRGDASWDAGATWSNDGKRLAVFRGYSSGYTDVTAIVVRADGTGTRVETEHGLVLNRECCAKLEWAPDDSTILMSPVDAGGVSEAQVLIDPNSGAVKKAPWQAVGDPAWQRRAP